MSTVADLLTTLDRHYPPSLAEDWDNVGLLVGDPSVPVTKIWLAVDVTKETITEAIAFGAEVLLTHHPLLFRPLTTVTTTTPKAAMTITALRHGLNLVTAHTNADSGQNGVSDALAAILNLTDPKPMSEPEATTGLGRIGHLPEPITARELATQLANRVPKTTTGIRLGGDPERLVRTVAVLGGSGDSFLDLARNLKVDAYVTSDLRHHPASDALDWPDAPVLIDIPHWAAEWLWLPQAAKLLSEELDLETGVSTTCTDPWRARFA